MMKPLVLITLVCQVCGYWAVVEEGKINGWTCLITGDKLIKWVPTND